MIAMIIIVIMITSVAIIIMIIIILSINIRIITIKKNNNNNKHQRVIVFILFLLFSSFAVYLAFTSDNSVLRFGGISSLFQNFRHQFLLPRTLLPLTAPAPPKHSLPFLCYHLPSMPLPLLFCSVPSP